MSKQATLWNLSQNSNASNSAPNSGKKQSVTVNSSYSKAKINSRNNSPNQTNAKKESNSSSSSKSKSKFKPMTEEETKIQEANEALIKASLATHNSLEIQPPKSLSTLNDANFQSQLWVDRHKPKRIDEIIGNPGLVTQIQSFLENFDLNLSNSTKDWKRSILISGAPGLGKSTAATVVASTLGFHIAEFNASDTRSKRSIEEEVKDLISNRGMNEFFKDDRKKNQNHRSNQFNQHSANKSQKTVVIMDEIDGMAGNEDRGGIQSVIQLIKTTLVPIICICNDSTSPKMRSLKNYTTNISWRRLPAKQLAPHIAKIAAKEGFQISNESIELMCESTQADIRQLLNLLQMWSQTQSKVTFASAQQRMDAGSKDFTLDAFSVANRFFFEPKTVASNPNVNSTASTSNSSSLMPFRRFGKTWIDERMEYYFVDSQLMPLFIQDYYPWSQPTTKSAAAATNPRQATCDSLHALSAAADCISQSDLCSSHMLKTQDYSLMPAHAFLSCIIPGHLMRGNASRQLNFPQWLGKNSSQRKNQRLAAELRLALSLDVHTSDATQLTMFDLPLLRSVLCAPLTNSSLSSEDQVDQLIQLLNDFGLTRDEWTSIVELTDAFIDFNRQPWRKVEMNTKTKTQFTKTYKTSGNQLKVARVGKVGQSDVSRGRHVTIDELEDEDAEVDENEENEENVDSEAVSKDDKMIKEEKKPKVTKKASNSSKDSSPNSKTTKKAAAKPRKPAAKRKAADSSTAKQSKAKKAAKPRDEIDIDEEEDLFD